MVNHLNHLNLTKGKISKLYKKKKQTLKKKKNGKRGRQSGRSYRKKRHLNLANKTMKNMQHGGGMFDWFTGKKNTSEGENQPLNNQPSSTEKPSFLSQLRGRQKPAINDYETPVINPLLQPKDIQQSNEKQEKMNQVIQELREKLKRDNKLQDSPDYENDDDVSNIPFEEEPTDKSVMNPIHLNQESTEYGQENQDTNDSLMNPMHFKESKVKPQENPVPLPQEEHLTPSTEYGEVIPETPEENLTSGMEYKTAEENLIPRIEYNQVTPEEVPTVNEESKPNCEYLNKIEIPQSHCLEGKEYKKLALKLHPDKNLACSVEAGEKFKELENQKCSNEDEEEVPIPQEYNEVTPEEEVPEVVKEEIPVPQEEVPEVVKEEIPVPQEEEEEEIPVPQEENLTSSTEYGEIIPDTPEEKHPVPLSAAPAAAAPAAVAPAAVAPAAVAPDVAAPVSKKANEEETITPTESTDSSLTELTNTFDQEVSRMPSSISNSFQNIIDYVSNQIVGKLSGYSSGGSDELQNGFIANNLNNRNFGVGGQKSSALTFGKGKTRRNHKKAKKYTRRV